MTLVSDNFTRANENPIASPWVDNGMTTENHIRIVSNEAANTGDGDCGVFYTGSISTPNRCFSEVTVGSNAGNGDYGPSIKCSVGGNCLLYDCLAGGIATFGGPGTFAFIPGSFSIGPVTPVSGDVIRLEIDGPMARAFVNGALVAAASTGSDTLATGEAGFFMYDSTARFSHFSGGDIVPANQNANNAYATAFALTENPISDSGKLIDPEAGGNTNFWAAMRSDGVKGWGQQNVSGHPAGAGHEAMAVLAGAWHPDQWAQGTVYIGGTLNALNVPRINLALRAKMEQTPNSAETGNPYFIHSGFLFEWGVLSGSTFFSIYRQDGLLIDTWPIDTSGHSFPELVNGDQVYVEIVGTIITAKYKQVADAGFTTAWVGDVTDHGINASGPYWFVEGAPGVGHGSDRTGGTDNELYGWSAFSAGVIGLSTPLTPASSSNATSVPTSSLLVAGLTLAPSSDPSSAETTPEPTFVLGNVVLAPNPAIDTSNVQDPDFTGSSGTFFPNAAVTTGTPQDPALTAGPLSLPPLTLSLADNVVPNPVLAGALTLSPPSVVTTDVAQNPTLDGTLTLAAPSSTNTDETQAATFSVVGPTLTPGSSINTDIANDGVVTFPSAGDVVADLYSEDFNDGNLSDPAVLDGSSIGPTIAYIPDPTGSGRGIVAQMRYQKPANDGIIDLNFWIGLNAKELGWPKHFFFQADLFIPAGTVNFDIDGGVGTRGQTLRKLLYFRDRSDFGQDAESWFVLGAWGQNLMVSQLNSTNGEFVNWDAGFLLAGAWNTIRVEVKVNSTTAATDGLLRVWINDMNTPTHEQVNIAIFNNGSDPDFNFGECGIGYQREGNGDENTSFPAIDEVRLWDNIKFGTTLTGGIALPAPTSVSSDAVQTATLVTGPLPLPAPGATTTDTVLDPALTVGNVTMAAPSSAGTSMMDAPDLVVGENLVPPSSTADAVVPVASVSPGPLTLDTTTSTNIGAAQDAGLFAGQTFTPPTSVSTGSSQDPAFTVGPVALTPPSSTAVEVSDDAGFLLPNIFTPAPSNNTDTSVDPGLLQGGLTLGVSEVAVSMTVLDDPGMLVGAVAMIPVSSVALEISVAPDWLVPQTIVAETSVNTNRFGIPGLSSGLQRPLQPQIDLAELWDAIVAQLSVADVDAVLGGANRVYKVEENFKRPEGAKNTPWGRLVVVPTLQLWGENPYSFFRPVSFLVRAEFNSYISSGYDVSYILEATHRLCLSLLTGFAPAMSTSLVAVPVWQNTPPAALPLWDDRRQMWFSSAEYRCEVSYRIT